MTSPIETVLTQDSGFIYEEGHVHTVFHDTVALSVFHFCITHS